MMNQPIAWDFHCHLDLFPNPIDAFEQAKRERLFTLSMTTTPQAWSQNLVWANRNEYVEIGLGLHPELVAERGLELKQLLKMLPETRFVGEIGLDGSPQHRSSYNTQRQIFEAVIKECNRLGNKTISIHSRRAIKDVLSTLERFPMRSDVKYILHWFSGSKIHAEQAVKLGCYFSINESMLLSDRILKILSIIPIDKIVTETDEPFRSCLAIERLDQIRHCVQALSLIHGISNKTCQEQINRSGRLLCGQKG